VVLAAASEPEMVLRPLCLDNVLTVAAAAHTVPVSAAAAPPVPFSGLCKQEVCRSYIINLATTFVSNLHICHCLARTHEIFHHHMTTMEDRFAVNQIGPLPPSPIGASDTVGDPDWNLDAVGDPEGNADGDGVDGDIEYVGDLDGGPVTRRIGSTYGSRRSPICRSRHSCLLPHSATESIGRGEETLEAPFLHEKRHS
jgi:hypothetical protein